MAPQYFLIALVALVSSSLAQFQQFQGQDHFQGGGRGQFQDGGRGQFQDGGRGQFQGEGRSQFQGEGRSQFQDGGHDQFQGEGRRGPPKFEGIPATVYSGPGKDGSLNFAYQTADGQMRAETTGADGAVKGSYSYVGPDGKKVTINYTADKNGFRASGPTLPTPPPALAPAAAPAAPQQDHQSGFSQGPRFPQGDEGFSHQGTPSFFRSQQPQAPFNFQQNGAPFNSQPSAPRGAPQDFNSQQFGQFGGAFAPQPNHFSPQNNQFSGGNHFGSFGRGFQG